ncbi:hypothetical protein EC968_001810 [Mortierella alpina]|nr:hypothetical protein EC968_001810 [Mortierella alpina]
MAWYAYHRWARPSSVRSVCVTSKAPEPRPDPVVAEERCVELKKLEFLCPSDDPVEGGGGGYGKAVGLSAGGGLTYSYFGGVEGEGVMDAVKEEDDDPSEGGKEPLTRPVVGKRDVFDVAGFELAARRALGAECAEMIGEDEPLLLSVSLLPRLNSLLRARSLGATVVECPCNPL